MESNDRIILEKVLEQRRAMIAPSLDDSSFFEFFCVEQILKESDLGYDEIDNGLIDGGNDGGIDGIYILINGIIASEDTDVTGLKQDVNIRIVIIQSKVSKGFSDLGISRIMSTCADLFNLDREPHEFRSSYSEALITTATNFKRIYFELMQTFPRLDFDFYYCSKGSHVSDAARNRISHLEKQMGSLFSHCNFAFSFLGARELLDLARKSRAQHLLLRLAENPISPGEENFVCLVKLRDYYQFISTDEGLLRRAMFDANVRDYEGNVEVNQDIRLSLEHPGTIDFWWLNNGITIVASKATSVGKALQIEDAKVVNGLQTSQEIHKNFFNNPNKDDPRNILIRVIVPKSESVRNRIIKATNNQTRIPAAALRATDAIQYDIEQFFETNGLFYDRRKNYHKNLSRPKEKIVSIPYLAQSITSILLQEPNNARGRPTSLLKEDHEYNRMFNANNPIRMYIQCAKIMLKIDEYLRVDAPDYAQKERTNIRFHLGMYCVVILSGAIKPSNQTISEIKIDLFTNENMSQCLAEVWEEFVKMRDEEFDGRSDRVAKSRRFDEALKNRLLLKLGIQQQMKFDELNETQIFEQK